MGLFRKAGETFEKTKQAYVGDDEEEEEPSYVCRSCEEPVTEAYEYCPHCGEETVEPEE